MLPANEHLRRIAYSCFIVTNLSVIVYCNLPHAIGNQITTDLNLLQDHYYTQADQAPDREVYERELRSWNNFIAVRTTIAACDRNVRRYAHYVGLDNRWQMFGLQTRFNWWYVIKGNYTDGQQHETVVLDLPRQSKYSGVPRTFWQYHFFDFREGKFHLNMYREPLARAAYGRFLAREYPKYRGLPIESVDIELHYQDIKSPDEARRTGSHLYPKVHSFLYNRFSAEGELEPQRTIYSLPRLDAEPAHEPPVSTTHEQSQTEAAEES